MMSIYKMKGVQGIYREVRVFVSPGNFDIRYWSNSLHCFSW